MQRYFGVAPVTEKSGGRCWIHWRWNAPTFLRQTLIEWAGQTVVFCPWAKAYYEQQRRKRTGHHAILRALAFKWLRILWRCWQSRVDYDQERYLQQLEKRRSPIATRARQLAVENGCLKHSNMLLGPPQMLAQARRANDVRLSTETRSRRCLQSVG